MCSYKAEREYTACSALEEYLNEGQTDDFKFIYTS